jgi:hypothetical protein
MTEKSLRKPGRERGREGERKGGREGEREGERERSDEERQATPRGETRERRKRRPWQYQSQDLWVRPSVTRHTTRQGNTRNREGTSDIPTHCAKIRQHCRTNILGG